MVHPRGEWRVSVNNWTSLLNIQTSTPLAAAVSDVFHFWQALPQAKLHQNVLTLPAGITWLGETESGRQMLVRRCYSDLLSLVHSERHAVVLGTPGIGKSWFGLYAAWDHSTTTPSIPLVYQSQSGELVVLQDHSAQYVSYSDVESLLNSSGPVVYIVDGLVPFRAVCKTLLISSPKKEVWHKWQVRRVGSVFYMPTFRLHELEICRKLRFPTVSAERLMQLYERWGGSVRFTLAHSSIGAQRTAIAQLSSDFSSRDLIKMLEAVAAADSAGLEDASHLVIHMGVLPGYTEFRLVFASPYMCNRALAATTAREKGRVVAFLQAVDSVSVYASLRGQLFERFAIAALREGGVFSLYSMQPAGGVVAASAAVVDICLPPRPVTLFAADSDLLRVCTTGDLTVPEASNFPTWDAVVLEPGDHPLLTFFQMTVSNPCSHGMKAAGLRRATAMVKVLQHASDSDAIKVITRFFWVCPKLPLSLEACGVPVRHPSWAAEMEQFALIVPCRTFAALEDGVAATASADAADADEDCAVDAGCEGPASRTRSACKRRRLHLSGVEAAVDADDDDDEEL